MTPVVRPPLPPPLPRRLRAAATERPSSRADCGTCHTLAAAGSDGTTGPNLDDLMPDKETVEAQVRSGGGGMPAFEGQLSDAEIEAVATYVSESAGS